MNRLPAEPPAMTWGYLNGWFYPDCDNSPGQKLAFLVRHGFEETGFTLDEISAWDEAEREAIFACVAEQRLRITPSFTFDAFATDPDALARQRDRQLAILQAHGSSLRNLSVMCGNIGGHRFSPGLSLEQKLERMSTHLTPLAAGCRELGMPLGLNNRGDFYMEEFVQLCRCTPDLYLIVDTANIFWAGEPVLPAFEKAAPHLIGTHWRDEKCEPGNRKPRGVLLHGCVTGEGDVPLEACFDLILQQAPLPEVMVMQVELFPQKEIGKLDALERCKQYLQRFRKCAPR